MQHNENIFDKNAIDHFYIDVLHKLLPKARHKSINFIGSPHTKRATDIQIDLADTNEINLDSPYYYDKRPKFIHYTTIPILINILRGKSIRLYNLQGMDDKLEFTIPLQLINKVLSEYEIQEVKKNIFCLSMCELELEIKGESLPAWREYGDDGNGIGIVLSFNESFTKDWIYFMLSKVYYTNRALKNFNRLYSSYKKFRSKYNLNINNFDSIIYKYFAFHKHNIYKSEKEVRLLYCQGLSHYDKPPVHYDINKNNEKTTYIDLELEWDWDVKAKEFFLKKDIIPTMLRPVISIDKIILGYRISNQAKYEIYEIVQKLIAGFRTKPEIIDSNLKAQF